MMHIQIIKSRTIENAIEHFHSENVTPNTIAKEATEKRNKVALAYRNRNVVIHATLYGCGLVQQETRGARLWMLRQCLCNRQCQ